MFYGNKSKEKNITGFKFVPVYKEKQGEKRLDLLRVKYLKNGIVIGRDEFEMNEEEAEKLRTNLMKIIRKNLGCEQIDKEIEVVNMFKMDVIREHNGLYDLKVEFIKNGNFYVQTTFCLIDRKRKEKIQEIISNNTEYSLSVERLCEAVTWLDIITMCRTI